VKSTPQPSHSSIRRLFRRHTGRDVLASQMRQVIERVNPDLESYRYYSTMLSRHCHRGWLDGDPFANSAVPSCGGRSSFHEGFEIESAGDSEYVRRHAANLMFAISRTKLRSDVFKSSLTCTIKGIILREFLWLLATDQRRKQRTYTTIQPVKVNVR
jgi:hypothetical protein